MGRGRAMAVRALALFANFFFFAFTAWHFALAPEPLQIVRASAGVALNDAMNIAAINAPRLGKLSNFMSSSPKTQVMRGHRQATLDLMSSPDRGIGSHRKQ